MRILDFVADAGVDFADLAPWQATQRAIEIVTQWVERAGDSFHIADGNAIHETAEVEAGAIIKSPCFIGPRCFIAAGAYLRGGVWLEADDIVGPGCELKTTFMFAHSKTAHLNFVGDSIIGRDVNIEAGAIVANYRNEKADKRIRFHCDGNLVDTGVDKFGAMIGDHVRIGANAVIAPGAALAPHTIVKRLGLLDQS